MVWRQGEDLLVGSFDPFVAQNPRSALLDKGSRQPSNPLRLGELVR